MPTRGLAALRAVVRELSFARGAADRNCSFVGLVRASRASGAERSGSACGAAERPPGREKKEGALGLAAVREELLAQLAAGGAEQARPPTAGKGSSLA